ncbi:iron ABC transporter permease [Salicibibacter cibarius]|uniref:Iron ABC transporter permease n=1 Tax=Salicibibacter cibarius TaxID=2743000 RepID=A0A7T7CDS1_9BACI|nr:iron ABC transporter permease [Salicibibacter cibarius]QQK78299.1 iron ABC transporter permease [Salicibibacter cibarius]
MVVFVILSVNWGQLRLTPFEVLRTLIGDGTNQQELVLFEFRMPRIVLAVLVGAGLGLSGAILQGISRNDLSDPGILGISSGASLAIVMYITFHPLSGGTSPYILPFLAFIGAGVTAVLIYVLSYRKGTGLSPTRLILTGIAVGMGLSAVSIVYTLRFQPEEFQFVVEWQAGTLWGGNWVFVMALLPWIVILFPLSLYKAHTLNLLQLHETLATNVGVAIERERVGLLAVAVGLAASAVATGGAIGFVGLVSPHVARRLVGNKHQVLLPATAAIGGLLVLFADTLARNIIPGTEIPAGIIVSLLGGPYFLYLLIKQKK